MLKGKIIELENDFAYCVIEEANYDNRKFILAAPADLNKDDMDIDNLVVKQIIMNGDSLEIVDVEDDKEAETITKVLLSKANKDE